MTSRAGIMKIVRCFGVVRTETLPRWERLSFIRWHMAFTADVPKGLCFHPKLRTCQRPPFGCDNRGSHSHAAGEGRDKFIPVRKEDLFSTLIRQGDFADSAESELFRRFARTLRNICHYEYSETLDRLRDDYYYFSPEVASLAALDRVKSDCAYDELVRSPPDALP